MKCLLTLSLLFFITGCGAPPTIRDSQVLAQGFEKARSIRFIYRNVEMKTTSYYSHGYGASVADTGFNEFGPLLAARSESAFARLGIAIVESKVLDEKEADRSAVQGAGGVKLPILILFPTKGKISANGHATVASYVFRALLIDPEAKRTVWKADVDTSTWVGQDFLMKHANKTIYNEAYADQLLNTVAEQMKKDGVI
jgi:hypothetical protein